MVWIIFFNMLQLSLMAEPLVKMVSIMTAAIPNLLKAALILLFAWVVAMILRLLFKKGAAMFHLESRLYNGELQRVNWMLITKWTVLLKPSSTLFFCIYQEYWEPCKWRGFQSHSLMHFP